MKTNAHGNETFQEIKNRLSSASDDMLKNLFGMTTISEESTTEDIVVRTALESVMESKGMIKYNENTWEYELI